jgi:hypothetical protein
MVFRMKTVCYRHFVGPEASSMRQSVIRHPIFCHLRGVALLKSLGRFLLSPSFQTKRRGRKRPVIPIHRSSSTMSCRRQTRKLVCVSLSRPILDSLFVSAVTRELPGHYPYFVIKQYIVDFVDRWEDPSRQFFDITRKELTRRVQQLVEEQFSQYGHGHLKRGVRYDSWFTCVSLR